MNNEKSTQLQILPDQNTQIKSCAFTGHRDLQENFDKTLLINTIEMLVQKGVNVFYNGVSKGFDLLSAQCVLSLKAKYPSIKLIACVPYYGQERKFSPAEQEIYAEILKKSDETFVLSDHYFRGCPLVRDRYMADRADVLVVYKRKETGGTAYTVGYFEKKYPQKQIIFL